MSEVGANQATEKPHIMLGLLETVDRDGGRSQRHLASDLGIALGLVNAYLKRCIKKGFVKVNEAPARRYAYYLTPTGFAEKSRLTAEYLATSLGFFRRAKSDCAVVFEVAKHKGYTRMVLAGRSDLAEIAAICAMDNDATIVSVVSLDGTRGRFVGLPLAAGFDEISESFDAVVVTDLKATADTFAAASERFGVDRVLVPALLSGRILVEQEDSP
jgi:DNA-binding MarR family transcriptional regulator